MAFLFTFFQLISSFLVSAPLFILTEGKQLCHFSSHQKAGWDNIFAVYLLSEMKAAWYFHFSPLWCGVFFFKFINHQPNEKFFLKINWEGKRLGTTLLHYIKFRNGWKTCKHILEKGVQVPSWQKCLFSLVNFGLLLRLPRSYVPRDS